RARRRQRDLRAHRQTLAKAAVRSADMRSLAVLSLFTLACSNAAPDVAAEPVRTRESAPTPSASAEPKPAPTPAPPTDPAELEKARDDFKQIARVLSSPRCRNCHPVGDAPLQGDVGKPHAMNISRTSAESGLPCTTCHRGQNSKLMRGPPGVPNWH